MTSPIIIIGGGVAGLVCALELQRAGRRAMLLESAPQAGGRVRTTVADGVTLDHGFQVLFTAYPTLREYLDLEALTLRRFLPAARIVRDGRASLIGDALRDPSLLLDTIFARAVPLGDKLRLLALRRFAQQLSVDECFTVRFAQVSTRAFLASRGFSAEVINGFFAPFYGGILLDRTLETSASILLFTFKMLAAGDTAVPAGGIGALTQQMASALLPGVLRTDTAVSRLLVEHDRIAGVKLTSGESLLAPHVVLATNAPTAAALAATAGVSIATPAGARGCTTLYFTAPTAPLPGKALWLNADPRAVISHAVTLTEVAPEYAPPGCALLAATAVGDAADLPDPELEAATRRELRAMASAAGHPTAGTLTHVSTWRVPYAQFAQPPGWREQRPTIACGMHGLWRASEVLHSSSLEGAARGGQSAARALLQST